MSLQKKKTKVASPSIYISAHAPHKITINNDWVLIEYLQTLFFRTTSISVETTERWDPLTQLAGWTYNILQQCKTKTTFLTHGFHISNFPITLTNYILNVFFITNNHLCHLMTPPRDKFVIHSPFYNYICLFAW